MPDTKVGADALNKRVDINAQGTFRRVAIAVEASGISLEPQGAVWVGSGIVHLDDPIDVRLTFKGEKGDEYDVVITINEKEQKIVGTLDNDGISYAARKFMLADFNLLNA